jgi:hypothetical protein
MRDDLTASWSVPGESWKHQMSEPRKIWARKEMHRVFTSLADAMAEIEKHFSDFET